MRTTKRFTPAVLDRFRAQGRGEGTFGDFSAWHQVTRGDPASSGRSRLLRWRGRLTNLLSNQEMDGMLFCSMLPGLLDVREQVRLALEHDSHPLRAYTLIGTAGSYPGTQALAKALGIKHPVVNGEGRSAPWVMSTDLVLTLSKPGGGIELLAVSIKPKLEGLAKRSLDLLRLEQEYWQARGVPWLLITREVFEKQVGLSLRRKVAWGLGPTALEAHRNFAAQLVRDLPFASETEIVHALSRHVGNADVAQRALWQAIWRGHLPIDLRRCWRPGPMKVISEVEFWNLNPVASRRSAWN
ncbi:MAG: Tn7 transposase TnsA N-terminal domain-containing protein [Mitsuaria chitosanitabida]|uniref:TnsA endonuclease N-terminal domain-containing protein n=1 Tax=Roseateles chitosanitabidus TaxID=65048 RepID=UPI001B16BEED|nr:TnsA endonuclease N-terminal domain-containing protein [Roseateles chitosanitabidus]MBO9687096.1 Tn7 transposase TnsA N-terminal domain-containing protein [Roseateles chitosanitabidus]